MGHNNLNDRNREKGLRYWGTERGSLHLSPHIFLCLLFVSTLSHFLPFSRPTIACVISERLKDSWLPTLAASIYLSSLPSVFVCLSSETVYFPTISPTGFFSATLFCPEMHTQLSTTQLSVWLQFNSFLIAYILCFCSYLCLYVLCVQRFIYTVYYFFFNKTNCLLVKTNWKLANHMAATWCIQACRDGEEDLLKFRNRWSPHHNHLLGVQGIVLKRENSEQWTLLMTGVRG